MDGLGTALTLLSGIAWTIVYAAAIRIGFVQRTYAIPAAALMLNIAWEGLYAVLDLSGNPGLQGYVNLVWACADVAILFTFFRFGFAEFSDRIGRVAFTVGGIGLLAVSLAVQLLFLAEFGRAHGAVYSAFLQNLLMSGLFIAMFVARRGARGQSLTIAVAKWLGTLAPTVQFGLLSHAGFVLGVGLLCSALDLTYIGLLVRARGGRPRSGGSAAQASRPARPDGRGRPADVVSPHDAGDRPPPG
ncbi:transmembrane-type terpene cyclase [Sinomonas soli]